MILSDVFRGIGHMTTSRYLSQQPFTHDSIVRSPELTKLPAELDSKATNRAQIKMLAVSLPKKTTAFEQSGLSRSFCQLRLVKIIVSRINSYSCKNLLMADSRYKIRRNPFYRFFMDLTDLAEWAIHVGIQVECYLLLSKSLFLNVLKNSTVRN